MNESKPVSEEAAPSEPNDSSSSSNKSVVVEAIKFIASVSFLLSSIYTTYHHRSTNLLSSANSYDHSSSYFSRFEKKPYFSLSLQNIFRGNNANQNESSAQSYRRRLLEVSSSSLTDNEIPSYMEGLMDDLKQRQKLFDDTPPEEVKYWFEYTGPLQKYFYRYSKSRGKADYFEGRDDSGVVSSRFNNPGGGTEHNDFFHKSDSNILPSEIPMYYRILDNCYALGSTKRPDLSKGSLWYQWFGGNSSDKQAVRDRCRLLITLNTVGAGRGSTMLWETQPPPVHGAGPKPWMSEQATAATHLERNLKEMDAMCATGLIAIRLQVLVCEPIPGVWTEFFDSMLPNCGGQAAPFMDPLNDEGKDDTKNNNKNNNKNPYENGTKVEERASPVQVVVVSSANTADTCHDLKSGYMEKRVQDLILAPPYLDKDFDKNSKFDPDDKTTHPELVSSEDYDLYIGMKWSSLITIRSVYSFLQASADIAAAAASPRNQNPLSEEIEKDGVTVPVNNSPSSPFLIPSFVRVSYVSEENNKVAKWRMHGDFFHPAAWEICRDSFDVTWIPDSLSGNGGINGICYDKSQPGYEATKRRIESSSTDEDCGQWWVYMAEEQMSLNPEVYANEATPPLVQGGGNQFWMLTERHRKEVLKVKVCEHQSTTEQEMEKCSDNPQAVMPLGDVESFLINFTPNTALGKKHTIGRRPGYSREEEREKDRELVRERKQLKGQEDIEKALFDYTVYPAALFRKDATIKAARARDATLTKKKNKDSLAPQSVKSSYYDVTIKKPREATLGWCQAISRKGLCTLYGQYFRESPDKRCMEACGLRKNWTKIIS